MSKKRVRRFTLRVSMSSIISFLLSLSARKCDKSLRSDDWGCNGGIVSIDALIASLAGPFCEEDTRTVMMVLAFLALVALPFQEVC